MLEAQRRTGAPSTRFHALDALRGIAAAAVLVFHLVMSPPQTDTLTNLMGPFLTAVADHLRGGVSVFFVLSGFVIAWSTRKLKGDVRGAVVFALRRQVRLDPPYYVVLAGTLLMTSVQTLVPGLVGQTYGPGEVVVNMLYLQGVTHTPAILAVAWTLCYEVQFYLFVVALTLVAARVSRRCASRFLRAGVLLTGLLSLGLGVAGVGTGGWFLGPWWMFALGMVLCWFVTGDLTLGGAVGACAVTVAMLALAQVRGHGDPWNSQWIAAATGIVILGLAVSGRLTAKPPRAWLYLGTISYSLYLVHLPVIDVVMAGLYKLTGDGTGWAVVSIVAGAAASLAAAHVLHVVVERRALRWAAALKPLETVARWSDVRARVQRARRTP